MIKNKHSLLRGRFARQRADVLNALEEVFLRIDPYKCVKNVVKREGEFFVVAGRKFPCCEFEHIYLISFGKAAVKMAKALIDVVDVNKGIVVSNEPVAEFPGNVEYFTGGHPLPNENSVKAGEAVLKLASGTNDSDLTFVLISGGGSALLEKPLVPLEDLQKITGLLMNAGADIFELNTVRKHLSEIKGGKLLLSLKGKIISLIISDVIGDSLDTIASGPTYFDNSTFSDALDILKKYNLLDVAPESVIKILEKGKAGEIPETLKEDAFSEKKCENILIATNFDACKAAENYLRKKGYSVLYLGSGVQGESREVAKAFGGIITELSRDRLEIHSPAAVIFGGETTVTVRGNGIGGRNGEFVLASLPFLERANGVLCSVGTDGKDGLSESAGAIADSDTIEFAASLKLNWKEYLKNNDSSTFFEKINSLIYTGKTGTNVADIVIFITAGNN